MNHGISQIINNLKTGNNAGKETVTFGFSKFRQAVLTKLSSLGFVGKVSVTGTAPIQYLEVQMKYDEQGKPRISAVQQLSKYSRRVYGSYADAHQVKNGYGALLVSTPKGVLTDSEVRAQKVGGEFLFKIW
ncbi:MAG: 30S ribosomal protein S8 [Sulfurimonadaceae bacterium]